MCDRFVEKEVCDAIWNSGSDKSPGLDGLYFRFIKHFFHLLKFDFCKYVDEFANTGRWPKECNASFIALIPKVDVPQCRNDFRPISLIRCIYKVVAKLLDNRLKVVLGKVVSGEQSAFLVGRNMLDSVVV